MNRWTPAPGSRRVLLAVLVLALTVPLATAAATRPEVAPEAHSTLTAPAAAVPAGDATPPASASTEAGLLPSDDVLDAEFVTRAGTELQLGGRPFRFSGSNMYWLALDDNVRDAAGEATFPSRFRIDDAMATAQSMGGTVVRAWANSVGCERCIQPELGTFDEDAFVSLDLAVASARAHDQRLILSLVDNWPYFHGSKRTYTDWRGLPESAFFSDPRVIADYQAFITEVVSHVNPHTGLAYRDDPTIMAWQTGNEMYCETCPGNTWDGSWTRAVADHLKAVAPRQLVVDGHGTDPACTQACLHEPSLDLAAVDLVDDHFYPLRSARVRSSAETAERHGKAYVVGEYDWRNHRGGDPLPRFLRTVETSQVAGSLLWVLIPHADSTGFVDHDDGFQYFYPGRDQQEVQRTRVLQGHAERMSGAPPPLSPPPAPSLTRLRTRGGAAELTWRGSAGAACYVVQRRRVGSGSRGWSTVANGVTDQRVITGATWMDPLLGLEPTAPVEYRVAGRTTEGQLGSWSPVGVLERGRL